MDRRRFLASSLATAALTATGAAAAQGPADDGAAGRQFYELRRYHLLNGPQKAMADTYLREALVPALNRMGISPVGVFNVSIGLGGGSVYVLMPAASADALASVGERLLGDEAYQKAGAAFLNAPQREAGFVRIESSLLRALEALPRLTPPPSRNGVLAPRMFEMRTYESSTEQDHRHKIEMVNVGELPLFLSSGFWPIFMGDMLIGQRMPNMTYMIGFPTLADRDKYWKTFFAAPGWKKLTSDRRFNFETLVTNVDNQILTPAAYSQI